MGHGEHKFILDAVNFVDGAGTTVYVASRESVLHENYTILQGENKLLFMQHKMSLNGFAFELQDASGAVVGTLHSQGERGQLPRYWFTDSQGDTQAVLVWQQGAMKFALTDQSSSQVYAEGSVVLPGGFGDLKAMVHKRYSLSIPSGSPLPTPVVLAFCVAIAGMPV
jgi:hypothetical protein